MKDTTRKQIAQLKGERAAREGQARTACPYPEGTAARPDKHNLYFNWQLGYTRAEREAHHV